MDQALPPRAEPPRAHDRQTVPLEQACPLLRALEVARGRHATVVTVAIQSVIQEIEPESLAAGGVDGFGDQETPTRDANGLTQYRERRVAVVESQQHEGGVERAVAKGESRAVVDDVGTPRSSEGPDVHGAHPRVVPIA